MTRGVALDGIVTDADGKPIAGAEVGKTGLENAQSALALMLDKTATRWWASAEGHEYHRNWFSTSSTQLQPDGSIRFGDLPAGSFVLS
jgi:hypothetical protein